MAEHHYDVVVIGAGPSGEGAAMNAAKHNKRVAIIDDNRRCDLHRLGAAILFE